MLRPYIQLYIDGKEIDFTEPININMTYAHQDLHNPTIVKNSFSKTLKIDGTPNNNRIFGCFGNMDRINASKEGEYTGAYFNPSRKVDFTLIRNGEQIERGYVKLNKVVKKGKKLSYEITLYGGLGQFLYNLQVKEDGEKMKLSDLEYGYNLNIEVNKNTVKDAWNRINKLSSASGSEIYEHINFAPCYNGIPEDFSADKVAINVGSFKSNSPELYARFTTSKNGYGLINGWLIGDLEKEYDEWQMCDLRSYFQRPVIRFKDVIDACCNPDNNGGYEVELDEEFFSADNPYYEGAWMTLPLLTEMEVENEQEIVIEQSDDKFFAKGGVIGYKTTFNFNYGAFCEANSTVSGLATNQYIQSWDGSDESAVQDESTNVARVVQIVAYNKNDKVIGYSSAYAFYTYGGMSDSFDIKATYGTKVNHINSIYRKQSDGTYMFGEEKIIMKVENINYEEGMYFKIQEKFEYSQNGYVSPNSHKLYYRQSMGYDDDNGNEVYETVSVTVSSFFYSLSLQEGKNKTKVRKLSKNTLLNSENTPCDYFLSYLKMFNLHIWSDNIEKKVYIKQRKNYFVDNVINIDELVDRDSDITIKPIVYDAKWYNFKTEFDGDGLLNKAYKDNYGFDYGIQKVNTNYNFDSSSKDLLEKSVFKNAICQRAKSKYYVSVYEDYDNLPPFYLDGFTTLLFDGNGDTTEGNKFTPRTTVQSYNWWEEKGYDFMPKPEFRNKDGKSVDGANVLLFYNGSKFLEDPDGNRLPFMITDDIQQFETLNDGEPCWIWSMSWSDYNPINYLPIFSRYLTNENNWVTHSWDFGTPKQIYIPDYNIDNSSDIYTNYWKNYINDEFDSNTREVDLKVLFKGKVNPNFLQNFVYYDGCIWKIMEIVDYNPCSQETTKVKMVKVQDKTNYLI